MAGRSQHTLAALLLSCSSPALAQQITASGEERAWYGDIKGRVRIAQLFSDDLDTANHLSFTDLRLNLDAAGLFVDGLGLLVDGRWRFGWTDATRDRGDISRLLARFAGGNAWSFALGRQVIMPAFGARVDGARIDYDFGKTRIGVFGGLKPHPITADLDLDFATAGVVYDSRDETVNHAGGMVIDTYKDRADRLYFTERAYVRLQDHWSLSGHVVVDLLAPRGIVDELKLRQTPRDDFVGGLDLTSASLRLRYRNRETFGVSVSGVHMHTILPNAWWRDRLAEERARRGFVVDGVDPVGTRRSSVRWSGDLYLIPGVTPYVKLRYDRRHNDAADAWEGQPGIKLNFDREAWIDAHYSWRQYFNVNNKRVSLSSGVALLDRSNFEAHAAFLYSRPRGQPEGEELFEFGGTLRVGLGDLAELLGGMDLLAQYQGFIDPVTVSHVFFVQLGYRVR
jgi:hypothetical protein